MTPRQIVVTDVRVIRSGETNGKPWTLREVRADRIDGTPIIEKLKTFEQLEVGETVTVEVEKRDTERYGEEFMLKRADGQAATTPRAGDGNLAADVADLKRRLDVVERQLLLGGSG